MKLLINFPHTNNVGWSLQAVWQLWRGVHLHAFRKRRPSPWLSVGNVAFPSLCSELLWLSAFTVLYASPHVFLSMSFSSTFNSASYPFCQRWKCQQSFWKPLSPTRPVRGSTAVCFTSFYCRYLHTLINSATLAGGMTSLISLIRALECARFNNFCSKIWRDVRQSPF